MKVLCKGIPLPDKVFSDFEHAATAMTTASHFSYLALTIVWYPHPVTHDPEYPASRKSILDPVP